MAEKLPWFRFYAADFTMDTLHLSAEQVGAYVLLLAKQWVDNALPEEPEQLARIARVPVDRFTGNVWPDLQQYFSQTVDGVVNERLERARTAQDRARAERSRQAKKAAKARWRNHKPRNGIDADSNAGAMPEQCSDDASQSQSKRQSVETETEEQDQTHDLDLPTVEEKEERPDVDNSTEGQDRGDEIRGAKNGKHADIDPAVLRDPWGAYHDDRGPQVPSAVRAVVPGPKQVEYLIGISRAGTEPHRRAIWEACSDILRTQREGSLDSDVARMLRKDLGAAINFTSSRGER